VSTVTADLDVVPRAKSARRTRRPSVAVRRHLDAATPWQRRDAVLAVVIAVIGAVGVGVCWNGASKEAAFRDQIGWTVGAFLFCGVFALAGGYWVLVGFRRTRHCMAQLRIDSATVFELPEVAAAAPVELTPTGPLPTSSLVTANGMRLAHRPDCLLARGKVVRPIPAGELDSYPSCVMCLESE
jgi:hypothetical protein